MPSHPVVLCPHASSTPPAPRFINPPPGLFQLRRCLGHHTRLSMAQCEFFFIIILLLLTPASLSLCATSLPSCYVCSLVPCPLPHATSTLSCHVHSLVPRLHPHLCCINPPSPGLSQLHRHPDLCAPCQMPLNAPPLHTVFCVCCAPTPSYALASPYVCVCACSCAIVHLLLYMY